MIRRLFLGLPVLAAGCSVLPDRPFIESQRFTLSPQREGPPGRRLRHALLLRSMRAAPGMEVRGLRRVRAEGRVEVAPYEEWLAPPAELAELALRQWLVASGRFTAVTAPGSRLATLLVLETELVALQIEADGARATLGALLLRQADGLGSAQLLGQTLIEARISVPPDADAARRAATMQAALGQGFAQLEAWISAAVSV